VYNDSDKMREYVIVVHGNNLYQRYIWSLESLVMEIGVGKNLFNSDQVIYLRPKVVSKKQFKF